VGYTIMEKIQVTAFFLQEIVISVIYIQQTRKVLQPSETYQRSRVRRVMRHLIYVNILIILMDIGLLGTEYANQYEIQVFMKGAVYGVKLRLEFAILNSLIDSMRNRGSSYDNDSASNGRSGGVHTTRLGTMPTHKSVHGTQPGNNRQYSVYIGKSGIDHTGEEDQPSGLDNGVIARTTEVTVHTSDIDDSRTDASGMSQPGGSIGTGPHYRSKGKDGASISSSEIELARAGG
jgi:hypothetical protein